MQEGRLVLHVSTFYRRHAVEPEQDPADVLLPADGEPAAVTHQKVKRLVGEIIFY